MHRLLCLRRHLTFGYFVHSGLCMHVFDYKGTIHSPRSSAILGLKKKQKKSSIYKGNKKKKKKRNVFSFYLLTPDSIPHALESFSFPKVLCYFPPHPAPLSTSGPSGHKLYLSAFDCPLPFLLLLPTLLTSHIRLDL